MKSLLWTWPSIQEHNVPKEKKERGSAPMCKVTQLFRNCSSVQALISWLAAQWTAICGFLCLCTYVPSVKGNGCCTDYRPATICSVEDNELTLLASACNRTFHFPLKYANSPPLWWKTVTQKQGQLFPVWQRSSPFLARWQLSRFLVSRSDWVDETTEELKNTFEHFPDLQNKLKTSYNTVTPPLYVLYLSLPGVFASLPRAAPSSGCS